jgi:hypothetical protein
MRHLKSAVSVFIALALGLFWLARPACAGTLYTAVDFTGGTTIITNTIWTNDPVAAVALGNQLLYNSPTNLGVTPTSGNTYEALANGLTITNNTPGGTLLRVYAPSFFPGDSLQLDTNTLIYIKDTTSGTTNIVNLILNGGEVVNGGDGGVKDAVGGSMLSPAGTLSYFQSGNYSVGITNTTGSTGGGANRDTIVYSSISGSGDLVLVGGLTVASTNLEVRSSSNAFSGRWVIRSGWLKGEGVNSLGTNSTIIVDPLATETNSYIGGGFLAGPSVFEAGYDINSAGTLILTNGGTMKLHQNCAFASVIIQGTLLANGTYYYATLTNMFPNSFSPQTNGVAIGGFIGGSGAITVQPYSTSGPPALSPGFLISPVLQATGYPYPTNAVYAGQTVIGTVLANGQTPLSYHWEAAAVGSGGPYTNLLNAGNLSGVNATNLVISNLQAANAADYVVVVTNMLGSVTSAPVTLNVLPTSSALSIISFADESAGQDWNTAGAWDNSQPAWMSVAANPGSTFELLSASWIRTPASSILSVFPGTTADTLTIDGDGNFQVFDGALGSGIVEGVLVDKGAQNGEIDFPQLVMNGGEVDQEANNGIIFNTWGGAWEILTNCSVFNDGGNDSGLALTAYLTGSGAMKYYGPRNNGSSPGSAVNLPGWVMPLNILGTSNTFTGQWMVENGNLLGSALNCLGTNSITVGNVDDNNYPAAFTNLAVFETLYDLNDPNATLTIVSNGIVYLHQNDAFAAVVIDGTPLANGRYTAAQLTAAYPNHFPAAWTVLSGSTYSAESGSISVGIAPTRQTPTITSFGVSFFGSNGITLNLKANGATANDACYLLSSTNLTLPLSQWTPVLTNAFDGTGSLNVSTNLSSPDRSQQFYILSY